MGNKKYLLLVPFIILPVAIAGCWGGLPGDYVTFGGQVLLEDGSPLEGIEVVFFMPDPPNVDSDGSWSVYTDENGWYSEYLYTLWEDRDFSITPSHPSYIFSPTSYSFPGAYGDNRSVDFTAFPAN